MSAPAPSAVPASNSANIPSPSLTLHALPSSCMHQIPSPFHSSPTTNVEQIRQADLISLQAHLTIHTRETPRLSHYTLNAQESILVRSTALIFESTPLHPDLIDIVQSYCQFPYPMVYASPMLGRKHGDSKLFDTLQSAARAAANVGGFASSSLFSSAAPSRSLFSTDSLDEYHGGLEWLIHCGGKLRAIIGLGRQFCNGVQFVYELPAQGTNEEVGSIQVTSSCALGRDGTPSVTHFVLGDDEYIISITFAVGEWCDSMQFLTNLGREYRIGKSEGGGTKYTIEAPQATEIAASTSSSAASATSSTSSFGLIGMRGLVGGHIHSAQFLFAAMNGKPRHELKDETELMKE